MIRIGTEFVGRVRDLATDGSGIVAHPEGQVFFVPGVWRDEEVRVRVREFRGRAGRAELREILQASPDRIEPLCPHHGMRDDQCGGCPWQFINYPAQLREKQNKVISALQRIGVDADSVRDIWGSAQIFGYRNRAQFKTDGKLLGYVAAGSNRLVDITECRVLSPANQMQMQALRSQLPQHNWRPAKRQAWNTLDIDEDTVDQAISPNQRRPFRQANSAQNQRMQEWLYRTLSDLPRSLQVLELFCGSGNFTQVLGALGFAEIFALDGDAGAIVDLQQREISGVRAARADLFSSGGKPWEFLRQFSAEILVLDPPRDGFALLPELLKQQRHLRWVCYISCNLATYTRDISTLLAAGFVVAEVQPLDQFPHTPHIELLSLLRQRNVR